MAHRQQFNKKKKKKATDESTYYQSNWEAEGTDTIEIVLYPCTLSLNLFFTKNPQTILDLFCFR